MDKNIGIAVLLNWSYRSLKIRGNSKVLSLFPIYYFDCSIKHVCSVKYYYDFWIFIDIPASQCDAININLLLISESRKAQLRFLPSTTITWFLWNLRWDVSRMHQLKYRLFLRGWISWFITIYKILFQWSKKVSLLIMDGIRGQRIGTLFEISIK